MGHEASSVKTLKALSREYPEIQDLLFIIGVGSVEQEEPTDRAAAIVAGALIEMFLEMAIRTRFVPLGIDNANKVFTNNGPLSTLSAKIKIAHALGLFSDRIRDELDHIREIRNAFAHIVGKITFDMAEVANVCERLFIPKAYPSDDPAIVRTAKQKFTLSTRVCWMLLSEALHHRADLVLVDPFLARMGRMHPELRPWLEKSEPQSPAAPQTAHRKKKKQRPQRPTSPK